MGCFAATLRRGLVDGACLIGICLGPAFYCHDRRASMNSGPKQPLRVGG
jgi:hypothetical protein